MLFSNALALLRKARYALEDLRDTIALPKHPAREAGIADDQRKARAIRETLDIARAIPATRLAEALAQASPAAA